MYKIMQLSDRCRRRIKLALLNVYELKEHEEIIMQNAKRLVRELYNDKVLYNPIIVSQDDNIILDGAHRVWAFQKMGYDKIIGMLVNYDDDSIKVDRWIRKISFRRNNIHFLLGRLFDTFSLEEISRDHEYINNDKNGYVWILGKLFRINELNRYDLIKKLYGFERYILTSGYGNIFFVKNFSFDDKFIYIIPPKFSKSDIRYFVNRGKILPPKSTRHMLQYRVINLNIPISCFNGNECSIKNILDKRKIILYNDFTCTFMRLEK